MNKVRWLRLSYIVSKGEFVGNGVLLQLESGEYHSGGMRYYVCMVMSGRRDVCMSDVICMRTVVTS